LIDISHIDVSHAVFCVIGTPNFWHDQYALLPAETNDIHREIGGPECRATGTKVTTIPPPCVSMKRFWHSGPAPTAVHIIDSPLFY
jgi:hypothetical protein